MTEVSLAVADWCATIEVDDFGPLGAYDHAFAEALTDAVVTASDDDEVKAIVLRARGADFAPSAGPPPSVGPADVLDRWHRTFAGTRGPYQALCFAKKVVVSVVTGACGPAGSNLVLCSDLAVADSTATFSSPFLDLPESNFVLTALTMRLNRAKSWLVRGTDLGAERAEAVGLVNSVVALDELDAELARMVTGITGMPLDGITMSKMLQQSVYDAHGVGREFDLADHYAIHRWAVGTEKWRQL